MSILVNGVLLDALPQAFRDDYWRTNHTDDSGMNLMPWSVPEATTVSDITWERPADKPHEGEWWIIIPEQPVFVPEHPVHVPHDTATPEPCYVAGTAVLVIAMMVAFVRRGAR